MRNRAWTMGVALAMALAACGKAPEVAAEKMIESAMSRDGTKAKVDLSNNSVRITTTDASGATQQAEIGSATVTEADVGVPFYPGAKTGQGEATRVIGPKAASYSVVLHSPDAQDKIAGFYRDHLKTASVGKQMMEMASGEGTALILVDEKSKSSIQIIVSKGEKGSDVMITTSKATTN